MNHRTNTQKDETQQKTRSRINASRAKNLTPEVTVSYEKQSSSNSAMKSPRKSPNKSPYGKESISFSQSLVQAHLSNRKKVVRMLIVVIFEFFLCWCPVYILQTWRTIDYQSALQWITPETRTFFSLMSFSSACFHPIIYCFMNNNFRTGFLRLIRRRNQKHPLRLIKLTKRSDRMSSSTLRKSSLLSQSRDITSGNQVGGNQYITNKDPLEMIAELTEEVHSRKSHPNLELMAQETPHSLDKMNDFSIEKL